MRSADNKFFDVVRPDIERMAAANPFFARYLNGTAEEFAYRFTKACQNTNFWLFARLPGVYGKEWSVEQLIAFKDVERKRNLEPWNDWIGINVEGTTFSGHPTRTTLGNTLRQMLYFFYYIEEADPSWSEPWKVREGVPKICVSGDDVCVIT